MKRTKRIPATRVVESCKVFKAKDQWDWLGGERRIDNQSRRGERARAKRTFRKPSADLIESQPLALCAAALHLCLIAKKYETSGGNCSSDIGKIDHSTPSPHRARERYSSRINVDGLGGRKRGGEREVLELFLLNRKMFFAALESWGEERSRNGSPRESNALIFTEEMLKNSFRIIWHRPKSQHVNHFSDFISFASLLWVPQWLILGVFKETSKPSFAPSGCTKPVEHLQPFFSFSFLSGTFYEKSQLVERGLRGEVFIIKSTRKQKTKISSWGCKSLSAASCLLFLDTAQHRHSFDGFYDFLSPPEKGFRRS